MVGVLVTVGDRVAGEHREPREDGAHHQRVPHPQQPLGPALLRLPGQDRGLHTGTARNAGIPGLQGTVVWPDALQLVC